MRGEIVPATQDHARQLALILRAADRDEVVAQSGLHPALALGMSLGSSDAAWTGLMDGQVAVIWGVAPQDELERDVGVPWMLGSDLIVQHPRLFLTHCQAAVEEMQALFPILENHVDIRNTVAIRWLKWLGFDIMEPVPHGPYKMPFHPFRRVRQ